MSSDLFGDEDKNGNSIMLEMNAYGTLFLTTILNEDKGDDIVKITFSPNEKGFKLATDLIDALNNWMEHIKTI